MKIQNFVTGKAHVKPLEFSLTSNFDALEFPHTFLTAVAFGEGGVRCRRADRYPSVPSGVNEFAARCTQPFPERRHGGVQSLPERFGGVPQVPIVPRRRLFVDRRCG